ncbi:MAG: DUF3656 domain-containing protein [Clostridia bacterium]|nr:DUF3656 domain-containing protein [Clostridia bacterium]
MELLAPAGNMECLKTAVSSGADAVYFAGKSFGARSFANNFAEEELREAVSYCRLRGVKTYVTVNTMTLDREFKELDRFIALLADAGADGVIVQDLGVVRRIHEICPELPVHASTQMTVHNLEGVRALEKLGITRVVLSRELSGAEIRHIAEHCTAELEVFVHGAMCMSYSGQCLMSSVLGGRSGNRGKCAQPCRLAYRPAEGKEQFYLSLKDMSLIRHLEELRDMGIASLKIEGRMKGPDYVAAVVETYRRCLDETRPPKKEEEIRLNRVFYRGGLTDGYFTGNKGPGMFAFDKPDNPYAKGGEAAAEPPEMRTTPLACRVTLAEGERPEITLIGMGQTIVHQGESPLDRAQKNPANRESVREQICKTGGTAFVFDPVEIEVMGSPFVPVKVLNGLRRAAIEKLETAVLTQAKKQVLPKPLTFPEGEEHQMQLTAAVRTAEQFDAIREYPFARIDVPLSVVSENPEPFLPEVARIVVAPPVIVTDRDYDNIRQQLTELHALGFRYLRAEHTHWLTLTEDWTLLGGHRLNVANSYALQQLKDMGFRGVCLSAELNLAQVRDIRKCLPAELLIYGHLPLMITENCVLKNMNACPCDGVGEMVDRKGKTFPVIRDDNVCRSVILNGVPLYLADKPEDVAKSGIAYGRLLFTVESPEDCREIARQYLGLKQPAPKGAYTRLHFYKGVL